MPEVHISNMIGSQSYVIRTGEDWLRKLTVVSLQKGKFRTYFDCYKIGKELLYELIYLVSFDEQSVKYMLCTKLEVLGMQK